MQGSPFLEAGDNPSSGIPCDIFVPTVLWARLTRKVIVFRKGF